MSAPAPLAEEAGEPEPLCVSFKEAVSWIAHRNLAGWSVGPVRLSDVYRDLTDFEADAWSHFGHALSLLLSHGARGKVRLYAESFSGEGWKWDVPLDPAFIANARYVEENDGQTPALYVPEEEESDEPGGAGYAEGLAVNYHDLIEQFWGNDRAADSPTVSLPDKTRSQGAPRRGSRRRGRPPEYHWPSFLAEALHRCLTGRITRQVELETQMAQWCAEHWGKEPSPSQVRDYARAALQAVEAYRSAESASKAENSSSAFSA